jgi:hypothetical protein
LSDDLLAEEFSELESEDELALGVLEDFENLQTSSSFKVRRPSRRYGCGCPGLCRCGTNAYALGRDELEDFQEMEEFVEFQAGPTGPLFRMDCPAPRPCGTEAQCRARIRLAIQDAIRLATRAAARLEASPRSPGTVSIFRGLFGHTPNRPVPWGGGRDSGGIVARRYRLAINALRGRGTMYRCRNIPVPGRTISPGEVWLGPSFWTQNRNHRGAIILHEMMHQYFIEFIRHGAGEHRRNNAFCFEAFAMRASGLTPPAGDVTACTSRPV